MALVAHFPLTGNTNDYSGKAKNISTSGTLNWVDGKLEKALRFNNSCVLLENPLKANEDFSIATFFKIDNLSNIKTIMCTRTAIGRGISIFIISDTLRFDSGSQLWTTTFKLTLNEWYHIVITRKDGNVKLYVNGTYHSSGLIQDEETLSDHLMIGAAFVNTVSPIDYSGNMTINDFRLYTTALTDLEIQLISKTKFVHYPLDKELSSIGDKVIDVSGYGNHATVPAISITPPTFSANTKVGLGATVFNGNDQVITRDMIGAIGYNSFTFNIWAYFDDNNARDVIFGNYNATHNFSIEKHTNNRLRLYWNANPDILTANNVLPVGEWCMITIVRDRISSSSSTLSMYVNGESIYNNTQTVNDSLSVDGLLHIGRDSRTGQTATKGKLNDFRLYMSAFTPEEVKDLYTTRAEIEEKGTLYAYDFIDDAEPTVNLLQNYPITNTVTKDHGSSLSTNWTINHPVQVGEEYVISADFLRNINHGGRIYCMFSLVDSNNVQIPGNSGLIPGWWASVNEALYKYFQADIQTKAVGDWYRYTLPVIKIPAGYGGGKINWIRFVITTSPTDASFITSFKNVQFEKKLKPTAFTPTEREFVEVPPNVEWGANQIYEQGIASFKDYSTVGITDGLIGYYPFNKTHLDYSGYSKTAIPNNVTIGKHASFNGTNGYVEFEQEPLPEVDKFTISLYTKGKIKPSEFSQIVHRGPSNSGNIGTSVYWIGTTSGGNFSFALSGQYAGAGTANIIQDPNTWYHLVMTYDGTTVKGYINGVEKVSYAKTPRVITDSKTVLGNGLVKSASRYYEGDINDLKFYDRALTEEEVKLEYNTMYKNEVQIHESGVIYTKDLKQY